MSAATHYAECVEKGCGETFANAEEARAHGNETLEAAKVADPDWISRGTISGHAHTVVNPTPEEQNERRIRTIVSFAVEDAIRDCVEDLWRSVDRGDVTEDEVRDGLLHYPDFRDAWDEGQA